MKKILAIAILFAAMTVTHVMKPFKANITIYEMDHKKTFYYKDIEFNPADDMQKLLDVVQEKVDKVSVAVGYKPGDVIIEEMKITSVKYNLGNMYKGDIDINRNFKNSKESFVNYLSKYILNISEISEIDLYVGIYND